MSRYRGPKLRIIRKLGSLPGLTHISKKLKINRKLTEYGKRLNEKQKLRYNYGISETQLYNYVKKRNSIKTISTLLEMRLDVIVYRFGFASTISSARQLVNHGKIYLNLERITIPSFQCKGSDIIFLNITNKQKINFYNSNFFNSFKESEHLIKLTKFVGKIKENVQNLIPSFLVNEQLVIAFYAKK